MFRAAHSPAAGAGPVFNALSRSAETRPGPAFSNLDRSKKDEVEHGLSKSRKPWRSNTIGTNVEQVPRSPAAASPAAASARGGIKLAVAAEQSFGPTNSQPRNPGRSVAPKTSFKRQVVVEQPFAPPHSQRGPGARTDKRTLSRTFDREEAKMHSISGRPQRDFRRTLTAPAPADGLAPSVCSSAFGSEDEQAEESRFPRQITAPAAPEELDFQAVFSSPEDACALEEEISKEETSDEFLPHNSTNPGDGAKRQACLSAAADAASQASEEGAADVNRAKAEAFIRYALDDLEETFMVLSFSPLPVNLLAEFPGRLLAPPPGRHLLDNPSFQKRGQVVIGVYTLACDQDLKAAGPILAQLARLSCVVLVAVLVPTALQPGHDLSGDEIIRVTEELLRRGAEDTFLDPNTSPGHLQNTVGMLLLAHERNLKDLDLLLRQAPLYKDPREVRALANMEFELLWSEIPRSLMPRFPLADKSVQEEKNGVGEYRFQTRCLCQVGKVLIAQTAQAKSVAVKLTNKIDVHTADEVENIYREYRFLRHVINHPNIVKCVDFLHTPERLYMVMEYAGCQSLEQYCQRRQCTRLEEEDALSCFSQIASALGNIHQADIVHRSVSLHHIVVRRLQQDGKQRLHCTLVDFRAAMLPRSRTLSNIAFGNFPYMAPEMGLGPYIPKLADAWSLGAVLLEIAGGLKSMEASANVKFDQQDFLTCLEAVETFFAAPDCHERALAKQHDVQSPGVVSYLQELLLMEPDMRISLPTLAARLAGDPTPTNSMIEC
mmetsp:Transcript_130668/g.251785  ORF Transcript_130668/g.251785 Transcript_130668/m.251785 type:complete len:775 (+) Transcript_130668:120-2444(+)